MCGQRGIPRCAKNGSWRSRKKRGEFAYPSNSSLYRNATVCPVFSDIFQRSLTKKSESNIDMSTKAWISVFERLTQQFRRKGDACHNTCHWYVLHWASSPYNVLEPRSRSYGKMGVDSVHLGLVREFWRPGARHWYNLSNGCRGPIRLHMKTTWMLARTWTDWDLRGPQYLHHD